MTTSAAQRVTAVAMLAALLVMAGCASGDAPASAEEWMLLGDGSATPVSVVGGAEVDDGVLALDGATGYATAPAPEGFTTTVGFTVSAWVALDGDAPPCADAVSQIGETAASFYLGIADGAFAFSMKDADTNDEGHTVRALGDAAIGGEGWRLLTGVFDASAGTIALFVDGEQAGVSDFDAPIQVDGAMRFGAAQTDGMASGFWPGAITGAAARAAASTADEIRAAFAGTAPESDPPALEIDPSTYGDGILNGTWDAPLTDEPFIADVESEAGLGTLSAMRLGFDGPRFWLGFVFGDEVWLIGGVREGDGGVFAIEGDILTTDNGNAIATYTWSLDGDELALVLADCRVGDAVCDDIDDVRLVTERVYTRSGTYASY